MITELTFAVLKYAFLALLWLFVWLIVRSLYQDVEVFSPHKSRAYRRKDRQARRTAKSPTPTARPIRATRATGSVPRASKQPTLLVVMDGPLAGTSVPLNGSTLTLGRAPSNTVVLDDEFVSSHHARVYPDPNTGSWAIEDLNSTNGTVVNQQRISSPTMLPAGVPVRIGATTFELR